MARTSEARIFIRISHAHKRKLKQLAKERGRTLSAFIRESFIL
ncbi:MAG: ribbon-helix-helix protein, CopG family [Cytophagia bacterium]|nr:ribbon-helix-helix protein, CopG family [Cytophagia bacterium]